MNEEDISAKPLTKEMSAAFIFGFYLLPVAILTGWSMMARDSWSILSGGVLAGVCGTLVMYIFLWKRKESWMGGKQEMTHAEKMVQEPASKEE